ncbi:MAG: histidine kinase dimerization/phosphoacceptor domain-containing protein, partial [Acidobacteria bacterium]|nr:histidine kinase dimerization/phosphoacceptor domain-containing protein [Candidatus Sulfomarinibacter sp. MAG AM2]
MIMAPISSKIAREVHDDLGQVLTAVKLDISWLKGKMSKDQKTVADKAEKTMALVEEILFEPRWDEEQFELAKSRVIKQKTHHAL